MERELIKIFNNTGTSVTKESEWYQLEETKALNLFKESIKIIHTKNLNNILGELKGVINGK